MAVFVRQIIIITIIINGICTTQHLSRKMTRIVSYRTLTYRHTDRSHNLGQKTRPYKYKQKMNLQYCKFNCLG